jgi:hypothetical protein
MFRRSRLHRARRPPPFARRLSVGGSQAYLRILRMLPKGCSRRARYAPLGVRVPFSMTSLEFVHAKEPPTVIRGKTPPSEPLTPGERRVVLIAVVVMVAATLIGAAIWAVVTAGSEDVHSKDTCVTVAMASSMGGGVEQACGSAARAWCSAAAAQSGVHAQAVQAQCRGAGILP